MTMSILTLLTDFGTDDWYVAAVKGTVLRLAPGTTLVDLSHQVPPGDVETAAFLLAAAAPTFPAGTLHLAVVDPGVGSARRLLLLETEPAASEGGRALFLAPDNGLLTPLLSPGARPRAVERPDLYQPGPGATFHGRDRFAPVAAFLLRGGTAAELGPEIDDPVHLSSPLPRRNAQLLEGRVIHVDRFGNLVTDIPTGWLPAAPSPRALRAEIGGHLATRFAVFYRQLPPGEPGVLPGSLGTLELALDGDSLALAWGAGRGDAVRITLLSGEP